MKNLFIIAFIVGISNQTFSQLIESLNLSSALTFNKNKDIFVKKYSNQNGKKFECYDLNVLNLDLAYYPVQNGIDCGYFVINEQKISVDFYLNQVICDLDYGSFEVYTFKLNSDNFIILNAIGNVSGSATRRVFNNLFKINGDRISYFAFSSIYGSENNFGDFNDDGKLDYLETSYDKFDPNYKTVFTTLINDQFIKDETKYIKFIKIIEGNKIKAKITEKRW